MEDEVQTLFVGLKENLASLVPFAEIEHIGSTSIPGSVTKGDLDIGIRVSESGFAKAILLLESNYKRNEESLSTNQYQSFICPCEKHDVGLQLFIAGSIFDKRFSSWRKELIANPKLLEQYNSLKMKHDGKSMSEYREAKSKFIRSNLKNDA